MLIYDDIYSWKGWGGNLNLGSGKCRLRIYDLEQGNAKGLVYLKPIIVVVTDVPKTHINDVSIRSCAGNIATNITKDFNIDPHRMLYVEYYPTVTYGEQHANVVRENFLAVEFIWRDGDAFKATWRTLGPPMLDIVKDLLRSS